MDLPLGIIRDRVPVETDLGTLGTAPVLSAALLGLRVLFRAAWSAVVWRSAQSGLSASSPLGAMWSRCSEKLPKEYKDARDKAPSCAEGTEQWQ